MNRVVVALWLLGTLVPGGLAAQLKLEPGKVYWGPGLKAKVGRRYAVVGAKILTMGPQGAIEDGVLLCAEGKIQAVGPRREVRIPPGYTVVDATDRWVLPGFIDLHCHNQASTPFGWGSDLNDMVHQLNPELRVLEALRPGNDAVRTALAAGVTTALFIPGSGTNVSGWGVVVKNAGASWEECVLRFPGALKVAQAGNPERGADLGRTRMGMNWLIRHLLREGKAYHDAWTAYEEGRRPTPPPRRPDLAYFRCVFRGEVPVIIHTQQAQVFQATMRIFCDELKIPRFIESHASFDAFRNAPEIARRGIHVDAGPRNVYLDRDTGRYLGLAALWWEGGVRRLTVNTDCPIIPQRELWYQAVVAYRYGLPAWAALEALTIQNARALGLAHRVGSLEPGKDADFQIRTGSPLDVTTYVERVFVDGVPVYDARKEGRLF